MSNWEEQFVAFTCFETDENSDEVRLLGISSRKDDIDKWKEERQKARLAEFKDKKDANEDRIESEGSTSSEDGAAGKQSRKLMEGIATSISSYRHLIFFSYTLIPTIKRHFTNSELYKSAKDKCLLVDAGDRFETYGVKRDQFLWLQRQLGQLNELDKANTAMPGAILLSIVATFDSAIADLLRLLLRLRPEKYSNSTKSIMIKDILSMKSFDDAIGKIVEDEVESIMRESHDKQVKALEDCIGVKIRSDYDEYSHFIEIFERRNLVAHGNLVINSQYLRNCQDADFDLTNMSLGKKLSLSPKYLGRSADRLMEFALLANFVAWKKNVPSDIEEIYLAIAGVTYQLIKDHRYRSAARIFEFVLFKQNVNIADQQRKRMSINLANAQKKIKNSKRAEEVLSNIDWSATSDIFKLCVASVREDIDKFLELMRKVAHQEEDFKEYLREWPVFDWVRDHEAVQDRFESIFGEPLAPKSEIENSHNSDSGEEGATERTIH